jgi:dihydroceramidase
MEYFWGPEDTSVHFCEDKYINSPWIAEYFNTLTSICYIIVGIYFLNSRISPLGQSLILVAFVLHMTLRVYAQMLDEISMLVLSCDAVSHIRKSSRWWSVPIIGLYFALHEYFVYFFIVFTMTQIYIAHNGLQITHGIKRWFIIGYITFFSIGTVCWLLDQFACEYVQEYQMHAFWHIFTSLAIGSGLSALI